LKIENLNPLLLTALTGKSTFQTPIAEAKKSDEKPKFGEKNASR
jgi:hypothetical protein